MGQLKNADCIGAIQALEELSHMEVSVKTAVKVAKLTRLVNEQAKDYEAVRMLLLEKFGVRDEDGKLVINKKTQQYEIGDLESFTKEISELLDATEEYDISIELSELPDRIKPEIIIKLAGLVNLGAQE